MEKLINSYIGKYVHISIGNPSTSSVSFSMDGKLLMFDEITMRYMVGCQLNNNSPMVGSSNFSLDRVVMAKEDDRKERLFIAVK